MWETDAAWPPVPRHEVAAIEAEGLVKVYRSGKNEVRALDGVDLEVREGTVLGLLGPNGAGKTTTVRILTTLLKPDAEARASTGSTSFERRASARRIKLSGQYAAIDENLTGRENLWMFGRLYQLSAPRRGAVPTRCSSFDLTDAADGSRRPLRRDAPPARPRERADRRAAAALPRRADDRARSAQPARDVGRDPDAGARRRDAPPDDAVPRGGGRARRRDRGRRPRQDHRAVRRTAEVAGRRRADRGRRARA